jgi:hypothetical protein
VASVSTRNSRARDEVKFTQGHTDLLPDGAFCLNCLAARVDRR